MTTDPQTMPVHLASDWRSLTAYIEATHERQPVPCRSGEIVEVHYWTSGKPVESVLAAQACAHCPIKAACRVYGIKHPAEAGIYGGMGPKQRKAVAKLSTDLPPSTTNPN